MLMTFHLSTLRDEHGNPIVLKDVQVDRAQYRKRAQEGGRRLAKAFSVDL